ncbi:MAG: stage II sporulation protein M, partial [Bacteroidales bacterium]|nr:stage II sporulation protein M [Bacteroidales bacterium]
ESALTIWIHGTLEIFVIIVAGASGLILGSSMLFPNTYTRIHSFSKGVKTGIKFIIGILPIFIVAAFLEGYVTRHTEAPDFVRLAIILTELAFIIWYFFIYPVKLALQYNQQKNNFWTKFIIKIIDKKPVKKTTWKEK